MNQVRYARCLATSRREFDFWNLMIHTPTVKRTRAQRRHVQTRQKRGRLLALEVLVKMNRQLRKVPTPEELHDAEQDRFDAAVEAAARDGRIFGEGAVQLESPDGLPWNDRRGA